MLAKLCSTSQGQPRSRSLSRAMTSSSASMAEDFREASGGVSGGVSGGGLMVRGSLMEAAAAEKGGGAKGAAWDITAEAQRCGAKIHCENREGYVCRDEPAYRVSGASVALRFK